MIRNEPSASYRRSGPLGIFDADGQLVAGKTFKTASGEMLVSLDGAAPVASANDGVAIGLGSYYASFSLAETNVNVFVQAIFRQKARLDLATKTTNCTTKIRWKTAGEAGNYGTLAWVQNGAVSPTTGTLASSTSVDPVSGATLTNYVFTFKDATTTVANFESLIAASANLEIDVAGAAHALATADAFAATALSGGLRDQSYTQMITQPDTVTPTAAQNAAAVANVLILGSYSLGDLQRLMVAIQAGPVTDFTTNTLVFVCPVTAKVRLTVPLVAAGRSAPTIGDLS